MPRKSPDEYLTLVITLECYRNCPNCIYEKIVTRKNKPSERKKAQMPVSMVKKEIVPSITQFHKVTITGGEPTGHPHFWEIVNLVAAKKPLSLNVITNGVSFSGSSARANAFFSSVSKIAKKTGTPIKIFVSVNDPLASTLSGGKKEMKKRVSTIKQASSGKQGVFLGFAGGLVKGQTARGLSRKYSFPEEQTVFFNWKKGAERTGSAMRRVLVNPKGRVFSSEASMLSNKPVGALKRESLKTVIRRGYWWR